MALSPTDIVQSFRLRFWREPRQDGPDEWRADVWHEQQAPNQEAVVVTSPEEAFRLVRATLQRFAGMNPDGSAPPNPEGG